MLAACATPLPGFESGEALRISDVVAEGDATRRASLRLVVEGLDADAAGASRRARGLYARALQVESGNPYAYLALARHHAEQGDAGLVREHLLRCRDLLAAEGPLPPRVEVHLVGLRGMALALEGRDAEAEPFLARAAGEAPGVWSDARLDAAELR